MIYRRVILLLFGTQLACTDPHPESHYPNHILFQHTEVEESGGFVTFQIRYYSNGRVSDFEHGVVLGSQEFSGLEVDMQDVSES